MKLLDAVIFLLLLVIIVLQAWALDQASKDRDYWHNTAIELDQKLVEVYKEP